MRPDSPKPDPNSDQTMLLPGALLKNWPLKFIPILRPFSFSIKPLLVLRLSDQNARLKTIPYFRLIDQQLKNHTL